jgi:LDH2 family malate/lactate/ureidoglycolate dehydrogenase
LDEAKQLCVRVFLKQGFSEEDAWATSEEILEAEGRGRWLHGLEEVPDLVTWASERQPELVRDSPCAAHLVGYGTNGPLLARRAMDLAIQKAGEVGIGIVGVKTDHATFCTVGANVRRAAQKGFVAVSWSAAGSRVAPWGGIDPVLGTNPLGIGLPTAGGPLVLDMGVTEITSREIRRARAYGYEIPPGAAVDASGRPTTSAREAWEGAMLAFGGHRGSGLAVAIELLGGPFVGAATARGDGSERGMVFLAMRPDLFVPMDEYLSAATQVVERVTQSRPRAGMERVLLPGQPGDAAWDRAQREGIDVSNALWGDLQSLAESGNDPGSRWNDPSTRWRQLSDRRRSEIALRV